MIIVHHMGVSQSERIVWLMEELDILYKLVLHTRAPILSPDSLKNIPGNVTGKSPIIEDTGAGITLSESGAICDYIIYKYANGRLALKPNHKDFHHYLYWYHFANASLQAEMVHNMFVAATNCPPDTMILQLGRMRMDAAWTQLDDRLKENKWLAGDEFTAADIMTLYCPTTQRYFGPLDDLSDYPNLVRYLKDCTARPAYQRAMEKAEPEMKILNEGKAPEKSMFEVNGVESDHWKK